MATGVVDFFEEIEVDEDQRQLAAETTNPFNLLFNQGVQVTAVVETSEVVCDDQLTDAHEVAGVFDGYRRIVCDGQ